MKTNAKFAPGDVLTTRSICNHDCIYSATVISRTEKSVKVDLGSHRGIVRRGLLVDDRTGNEYFFPYGRYSMAPSFRPPVPRPFDNPGDVEPVIDTMKAKKKPAKKRGPGRGGKRAGAGRPPVPGSRSALLALRVTPAGKERIIAAAKAQGITAGALVERWAELLWVP